MPERVRAGIFCNRLNDLFAGLIADGITVLIHLGLLNCHARSDLRRLCDALHHISVLFDVPLPVGKNEVQITLRARKLPFLQCVDDNGRNRDRPLGVRCLGQPDGTVFVHTR